jgi:hypothetical protein
VELLEALGGNPVARFFRTSFYAYPVLNSVHILAIGALVTAAILMDLRILGAARGLPVETVIRYLRPVAVTALVLALLSGFLLFSVRPVDYVANLVFRTKMLLLVVAVANALLFTSLRMHRRGGAPLALVSIGLWLSVLFAGRLIGFIE